MSGGSVPPLPCPVCSKELSGATLCKKPVRELFSQVGPEAQERRRAEACGRGKGQLLVLGGLAKVSGLFNFSTSMPSTQLLQIFPLLPASLLLTSTLTKPPSSF